MRVDVVAPPMAGHLHPALGIAVRLAEEPDLDVRVLTTEGALDAVQASGSAAGVEAVGLLPGADERLRDIVDPPHRVGSDPRRLRAQLRANIELQRELREHLHALWSRRRPDLVIADFTMVTAGVAADDLGLPWWTSHPSPCAIEGRTGPPAYLGGWRPGRGRIGRGRDAAGRALVRAFKTTAPRWSGADLAGIGVPSTYRADGSEAIYSPRLVLGLTPPAIEYPRDLPSAVRLVGPVLHTPPTTTAPPVLTPGRRHVLVTAGTHLAWHKRDLLAATARAAAALPDVELHLSLGGSSPDGLPAAPGVVVHQRVDYARHMPDFDAVVHHGGSGVLAHTLAAGLPAVVWPVDYDQADHAVRLEDAGVALRLRHAADLPDALRRVLASTELSYAARRIAEQMRRDPAIERIAAAVLAHREGRDPLTALGRPR